MFPNPNYHEPVGPGVRWALRHLPFYGRWYRFLIFWPGCDKGLEAAASRPRLRRTSSRPSARPTTSPGRCSPSGSRARSATTPTCSPRWCPTTRPPASARCRTTAAGCGRCTRDNVDLVRTGIDHIEADAVVTVDGERHACRRHRLRHRLPRQRLAVADGDHRPRRRRPARAVGRAPGGLPRASPCRTSRTCSACTARARTWPRRQPDLPLRVPDAVHHRSAWSTLIDGGHRTMEPRQERYDDWHERCQAEMKTTGVGAARASSTASTRTPTARSTS